LEGHVAMPLPACSRSRTGGETTGVCIEWMEVGNGKAMWDACFKEIMLEESTVTVVIVVFLTGQCTIF